jgi:hypothetical protein
MGTLHELPDADQSLTLDSEGPDVAFGFMLFVFWAFSVARVVVAAEAHEVFGAEASIAFIFMLALPIWGVHTWLRRPRRRKHPARRQESAVVLAFRRPAEAAAASRTNPAA